jgi:LacI family transcriptional regulator
LGLLQQCVSLGLRVPEDLAIVGYDDIEFAAAAAVPLTSVRQPRQLLGRTAAELLLDESSNPDHEHQRVTFTPELVVRTSTRGTL